MTTDNKKAGITEACLSEYDDPVVNHEQLIPFRKLIDFAQIQIDPQGIPKLESLLERYTNRDSYSEEYLTLLDTPTSGEYEYLVALVQVEASTDRFEDLALRVIQGSEISRYLDPNDFFSKEEQKLIIRAGMEQLRKCRRTDQVIDESEYND